MTDHKDALLLPSQRDGGAAVLKPVQLNLTYGQSGSQEINWVALEYNNFTVYYKEHRGISANDIKELRCKYTNRGDNELADMLDEGSAHILVSRSEEKRNKETKYLVV